VQYRRARDLESWRHDARIEQRGFAHRWESVVADGNGEDRFLELVDAHVSGTTDLLDVGCGHGELAIGLAGRIRSAVGVDREPRYVELARELAAEEGAANVSFLQAELAGPGEDRPGGGLPLGDGSVSLVTSRRGTVLARFADDLLRVARPGSVLIGLHAPGGPPPPPWAKELPSLADAFDNLAYDVVAAWVTEPLARLGLERYRLSWLDVPEDYATAEALYARLRRPGSPSFEDVAPEIERVFARHGDEDAVRLRHQRLLYVVELP
jgi:SAM-dependent methyltransferase